MSEKLSGFMGSELLAIWQDGEKLLASDTAGFHDFSFIIFPFAKVYEGFLKKLFFQIGAINEYQFKSERWRVGRALNPELEKEFRHEESVYDRMISRCSVEMADRLWETWKKGRNQIFHYFPQHFRHLSFEEAKGLVNEIEGTMELALGECRV